MLLRRRYLLLSASVVILLISVVVLIVAVRQKAEVFAPLGPYVTQTVTNRVAGVEGPAAHDGDVLVVEGVLCNKSSKPVDVLTTLSWQAIGATGTFVNVGVDIPQVRKPGCETFDRAHRNPFRNPMPRPVIDASRALRQDGLPAVWRVVGFEVPVLPSGKFGVRVPFNTESVQVVP